MSRPDPAALSHLLAALLRVARVAASRGAGEGEVEGILASISYRWARSLETAGHRDPPARTPLSLLRERFALPPLALDALLLSLSPLVEPAFAQALGAAGLPGAAADGPSLSVALDLLVDDPVDRLEALRHLDADSPLRRWRLLEPRGPRAELRAASRLVRFLMGDEAVDPTLRPRLSPAQRVSLEELGDRRLATDVSRVAADLAQAGADAVAVILGADGASRRHAAEALASRLGVPAIHVDLWGALGGGVLAGEGLALVLREAALLRAALLVDAGGPEGEVDAMRAALTSLLEQAPVPVVVLNRHLRLADLAAARPRLWTVDVPRLSQAGQRQLWQEHVGARVAEDVDLVAFADRFDMSAGQVAAAARLARALADGRGPAEAVTLPDLQRGSVEVFTNRLGGLAWRLPPSRLAWPDLVIGKDVRRQLGMMVSYMRHRRTVYDTWGMSRLLSGGRGVKALFYGPPGTGKTLAASVMARELGLDVYQVDLSQIVSKWVGETEKNLDKVLSAAEDSQVILLFDEADALFGGRGDVKSATDRYANMEVNYLLQRFDHYDGAVILTSNLVESLDKAFARRLHFLVEFPFPDEAERRELWSRMLGGDLPVAREVDPGELARKFELAGGNIRNAVMTAAFLAAERREEVGKFHLFQALAWELQKQGMVPSRTAFGEHWGRLE